jgi:hypothetical protein
MLNNLPCDIQYNIGFYVPNIFSYMFTNKSLYENSNKEYLNRVREQNIDEVNREKSRKKFDVILDLTFVKLSKCTYRSIDSFILYGIYDHLFITLDSYKKFVKTYEEEGLWEDCIIQMNGAIVVGKISYERFVSVFL